MYIRVINHLAPTCDNTIDVEEIKSIRPGVVGSEILLKNGNLYIIEENLCTLMQIESTFLSRRIPSVSSPFLEFTSQSGKKFLIRRDQIIQVDDCVGYSKVYTPVEEYSVQETYLQIRARL